MKALQPKFLFFMLGIGLLCLPFFSHAQIPSVIYPETVNRISTNELGVLNDRLLFVADNKLLATDGDQIFLLADLGENPFSIQYYIYNNKYYLTAGTKIYVSDGTTAGTSLLFTNPAQYSTFNDFLEFNGDLYFRSGIIYRYNESMAAPEALPDSRTAIQEMAVLGNQLYFFTIEFIDDLEQKYYRGDGTVAGSTLISEDAHSFVRGCVFAPFYILDDTYAIYYQQRCSAGDIQKFMINDQVISNDADRYNWYSLNGQLHFTGTVNNLTGLYSFQNNQPQLIIPEDEASDKTFRTIVNFNNQDIVFSNHSLWTIQGNSLANLQTFPSDTYVSYIYQNDDKMYFEVGSDDGGAAAAIWETDGTVGGTNLVYEFNDNFIRNFGVLNDDLYYVSSSSLLTKLNLDPNYNPPTVTLSTANTTVQGPFTVTASFSQSVTGFTLADVYAPGFVLSNLSGSGTNYTFTATPGPNGLIDLQVLFNTAFNSQNVGNLASNVLEINAEIDPFTLCTTTLTPGPNSVAVASNYAPRSSILLIRDGQTVYSGPNGTSNPYDFVINDLEPGTYYYQVSLRTLDYDEICIFDGFITVSDVGCTDNDNDGVCASDDCDDNNPSLPTTPGTACNDGNPNTINDQIQSDGCTCAGEPDNPGDCDFTVTSANGGITITGLTAAENMKVFDDDINIVDGGCNPWNGNPCSSPETINGLIVGARYFVSIQSDDCEEWIPIVVTGVGCTDNDGDGICASDDCDDNNPNLPATPGTACNDGNPNTINDQIQSDGCTCAGEPDNPGDCDFTVTSANGGITITGLTAEENMKVFDDDINIVDGGCNPWNGNPCSSPETINGLIVGARYYVSIQSDNCEEWIPIIVTGVGCTDNDGDGICASDDCDDNNPSLPATPGTACNDGNSNTINDQIQSDGCTCAGEPDNPGDCDFNVTSSNGGITITGLSAGDNMKIFDNDITVVNGGCNPWNGNPCSSPEVINGLTVGANYYVSIESDDCQEWIPITVIGSSSISSMPSSPVQDDNSADVRNELDAQKRVFETSLEITNLFPNPVRTELTVELNSMKEQEGLLRVFDINGRVVVEKMLSLHTDLTTYTMDVQALSSGVYQLSINNGKENVKKRFVKH